MALRRVRRMLGQLDPQPTSAHKGGPLVGMKVLDFTQFGNGPSATAQLSDNGADVLKVEPPEGDGIYGTGTPGKVNPAVEALNRGKRSMVLDLKNPGAKAIVERLVKWADVVTENYRPGIMDRFGIGYDQMKQWNPAIIYCSNSGFGAAGEWATRPSYDGIAQAFTGIMTQMGGGPDHKPVPVEWAFSDEVGAMNFYASILNAFFNRLRTGKGCQVTTSQTGATMHFQRTFLQGDLQRGRQRNDGERPGSAGKHLQQILKCSDGQWMVVTMGAKHQFDRFCTDVLGHPEICNTEAGKKFPVNRANERDAIFKACQEVVVQKPRDFWLAECEKGQGVPAAPCSTVKDIGDPEHSVGRFMRVNKFVREEEHRDYGKYLVVGQPGKFSSFPNDAPTGSWHAPDIGEHTKDVLSSIGFSDAEVAAFTTKGGPAPPAEGPHAVSRPSPTAPRVRAGSAERDERNQ